MEIATELTFVLHEMTGHTFPVVTQNIITVIVTFLLHIAQHFLCVAL